MEDPSRTTDTASLSDIQVAHLHHRHSVPDVPEDVEDELMLHFNDPNWDFRSTRSISIGDVQLNRRSMTATHMDVVTEVTTDTESQISPWHIHNSKAFSPKEEQLDDSPYPEVRAAVSNTDDPTMVVNTFRVWFIGLLFSIIVPAFNTVITLRFPSVPINTLFVLLLTPLFGKLLEWILPKYRISAFGYLCSLNPGPFNIKEHTLIAIMSNVIVGGSEITDVSAAMRIVYGVKWSIGEQLVLALPIQIIGFSFAGVLRQFLVWPSSMIWPGVLVRCALLNTMHESFGKKNPKHIPREHFFYLASLCSFVWYWFPGYLWTGLSVFNWACWISPKDVVVNSLFGSVSGLGMGLVSFDWAAISEIGSPLVVPFWAQLNMFSAFVIVYWLICPIMWAKNVWYSQHMPMSVPMTFDNTGVPYNLSAVVTNSTFDEAKYEQYSPMFFPITIAFTYGTIFAMYPASLVHTFLWYRKDIVRRFRSSSLKDEDDIHSRLMTKYPEVPHWWFFVLGVVSLVLSIIGIEMCHTGLPVWAFFIAIVFSMIFVIPFGMLQAITNLSFDPTVLAEIFFGYVLPGRPLALMVFKLVGGNTGSQATMYTADQKFGHYMKIPPRLIFCAQVLASVVATLSSILAQQWALDNIPDICSPHQKSFFTCPSTHIFNTASIIWGGIGPRRIFSPGALYSPILWSFLIGAVLPIPFYYLARRYPRSFWRYVNIPTALFIAGWVPPLNGTNFTSWILVGFIFQWFMRRHHFRWWLRYNYPLSAGLDAGVVIGLLVIFFSLQMRPNGGAAVNWWGNSVWKNTADAQMIPLKMLAHGEMFGPRTWS